MSGPTQRIDRDQRHPHARRRAGRGPAGAALPRLSGVLVFLAPPARRRWPPRASTPSRPTCAATARPTRPRPIDQYTMLAPGRRHGRPARRARRRRRRSSSATTGARRSPGMRRCCGPIASAASSASACPFRPRGPVRPTSRHAADGGRACSISSTSRSRAWPRRSSSATRGPRCAAMLYGGSGDGADRSAPTPGVAERGVGMVLARGRLPRPHPVPAALPAWLSEARHRLLRGEFRAHRLPRRRSTGTATSIATGSCWRRSPARR